MTLDKETLHLLQFQGARMYRALHSQSPPDRRLAKEIQVTVDEILDRRPRAYAVASDGEVIFDSESSWVKDQVTTAVNDTGKPEVVLPHTMFGAFGAFVDEEPGQ